MKNLYKLMISMLFIITLVGCANNVANDEKQSIDVVLDAAIDTIVSKGSYERHLSTTGTEVLLGENNEKQINDMKRETVLKSMIKDDVEYVESKIAQNGNMVATLQANTTSSLTSMQLNKQVEEQEYHYFNSFKQDNKAGYIGQIQYLKDYYGEGKYAKYFAQTEQMEEGKQVISFQCMDLPGFKSELLGIKGNNTTVDSQYEYKEVNITLRLDEDKQLSEVHESYVSDYGDNLISEVEANTKITKVGTTSLNIEKIKSLLQRAEANEMAKQEVVDLWF